MELYHYFRSSASYRVRIALALKGLPFELIPVHLVRNEQLQPPFNALSAARLVPVLRDDDALLNIIPHLAGDVKTPPHERLFWRLRAKEFAVREGAWKLIKPEGKPAQLFDLASDLGEKKDVAAEKPDLAQRLAAMLATWRKELKPPVFPGSSVKDEDWGPGGINQKSGQPKKTNP